jgi:hypothetical protein
MSQNENPIKRQVFGWHSLQIETFDDGAISATFKATDPLTLNIASRRKDAHFRIRACLKRHKPTDLDDDESLRAVFAPRSKSSRGALVHDLCQIIDDITRASLTPKMVCESLGITSAQRETMTRDGLLRSSGQASFQSDNRVGYYKLYSPHSVREIILGEQRSAIPPADTQD